MPLVIFDRVIYELSAKFELDFLPFRMWIGMWTVAFLLLFLAFGISVYIRYLTRFTLEVFLLLIGFCVIYNAGHMLHEIKMQHPVSTPYFQEHSCVCLKYIEETINSTESILPSTNANSSANVLNDSDILTRKTVQYLNVSFSECVLNKGLLSGGGCHTGVYFLSVLITLCTVLVVSLLAYLRLSGFFPRSVSLLYFFLIF